jgi:hypothetical protein
MTQIRDMDFTFQFMRTMTGADGNQVDMWYNAENRISFALPHGNQALVHFIVRSLTSGAKVLRTFNINDDKVERDFAP